MTLVLMAIAGGFGAALRYFIDSKLPKKLFPTGTFTVNFVGSALLGLCTGLQLGGAISATLLLILGTGFAGGFTTFSTASLETYTMLKNNQAKKAYLYAASMLLLCLVIAYVSLLLGFTLAK
ncbi:fluoride efflux transporter CrcB [Arcanobacterium bovis]|uniref:Fluoride-specific ion channel FluC n=1 Tax=Arcanobacterium bovis TaxID=2529275 RepID=A0A4Q9V2K8_9ACTO|nr:fluoride efflux transporter CrcB [Arcanobacterium bovis]TBW22797.1 fluoride efflux transporter CrcB [Arcanobacterium bovis]